MSEPPAAPVKARRLFLADGMGTAVFAMAGFAIVFVALVAGLSPPALRIEDAPAFHNGMQILAVVAAAVIFGAGWHAARARGPAFPLVLVVAFLAVGLLDAAHLLAQAGMPPFATPPDGEKAARFWFAARLTAAAGVLAAALVPQVPVNPGLRYGALAAALAWAGAVVWGAGSAGWLPALSGPRHGAAPFAPGALLVALHAAAALAVLARFRPAGSRAGPRLLAAAGILALSEAAFALASQARDGFNLLGQVCRVAACVFLARAVFVTAAPHVRQAARDDMLQGGQRFRKIFDAAPDALFLLDAGGRIVMLNPAAEAMLGYQREELVGGTLAGLVPETRRKPLARSLADAVPAPVAVQADTTLRHKSGERIPVFVTLSQIDSGGQRETLARVRDVTTTVEMENLLRRHSQEFQALVDNAPDVIVRFDRELRYLYANPANERVIGMTNEQCLGKTWAELGLPPEAATAWQQAAHEVFERGEAKTIECGIEIAGMGLRHFHVRMVPERDLEDGVVSVLLVARDISERKRHEDELFHQARHDGLTGLPNRALMLDRFQQALAHTRRSGRLLVVAYLDLDNFKGINDTLGHGAGDDVLRQVAVRISEGLRQGDTIGRQSGDEFILLLPDIAHVDDAAAVAGKILGALARPYPLNGREVYVTGSLGLSVCPSDGEDAESLLRNADVAMFRAKEEGRNAFRFYVPEMDVRMRTRVEIEHDLRQAIKREELVLHYQPRVSLRTGEVLGFEALVRWNHPREGLIGPERFIGVAEDTGLIMPLGDWVLRAACRQARHWQDTGAAAMRMSVNLSARQFRDPGLVGRVEEVLAETALDPALLELEITESTVMHDSGAAIGTLRALKTLGVTLAVDDFGTGYSSLSYLKLFPIDVLKVDRSFVREVTSDPDDAAIVQAIVSLAHSLGLGVVAEGVEAAEQAAFLRRVNCDEMQGYLFSRPLPEAAACRLLRDPRRLDVQALERDGQAQAAAGAVREDA